MSGDVVERLRSVVSACAAAIGNGAFVAPTCSIEFMEKVPHEIQLAIASQAAEIERLKNERDEARAAPKVYCAMLSTGVCDVIERAETAERLLAEARAALTPSAETKAAYMGEFYERVEVVNPMHEGNEDDEPETIIQSVPVSWTTIKEIMAAISARTLTNGVENGR